MKRVLVTGMNGQVGHSLMAFGTVFGFDMIGCCRQQLDVTSGIQVARMMHSIQPDIVINAAAYTAVDDAELDEKAALMINEHAVLNLANSCSIAKIPLFHISTDYVFDGSKAGPYIETDKVAPINAYGRSKVAGEEAIRRVLGQHIILRTSWVFSENGDSFPRKMMQLAADHKEIKVIADQLGGPTSANSIARALLTIIKSEKPLWGTYHFSGMPDVSWFDFADKIFSLAKAEGYLKNRPELLAISSDGYQTLARRPKNSRLCCDKIFQNFGISRDSWKDDLFISASNKGSR